MYFRYIVVLNIIQRSSAIHKKPMLRFLWTIFRMSFRILDGHHFHFLVYIKPLLSCYDMSQNTNWFFLSRINSMRRGVIHELLDGCEGRDGHLWLIDLLFNSRLVMLVNKVVLNWARKSVVSFSISWYEWRRIDSNNPVQYVYDRLLYTCTGINWFW